MKLISIFLFVMILGITYAQHNMHDMNNSSMNMSSTMLQGLADADLEINFLSGMIEHHKGAVTMAQWILERTQNTDIKTAAEAIIAAQEPEIQQMTRWLRDWYGQDIDKVSAAMMQNDMNTMMQVMETSTNPDAIFLEQMSLHHSSAIDMAQSALLGATHTELREFATNIIVMQSQEIAQYQTLKVYVPN